MSAPTTVRTPYQAVYDLSGCYTNEAWGRASGHAWDRLEAIAGEHQRGDIDWDRAVVLVAETNADIERDDQRPPVGALADLTLREVRVILRGFVGSHGGLGVNVNVKCLPGYSWWTCPDSRTLRNLVDAAIKGSGYKRSEPRTEVPLATPSEWMFLYYLSPISESTP